MNYTFNATGKSLGRVATAAAVILRGKNLPTFKPNLKPTNKVVITGIAKMKFTGNKLINKIYTRHSGYPGGLKTETLKMALEKKGPAEVLRRAIYGMLPANKLRRLMMNNLTIKE